MKFPDKIAALLFEFNDDMTKSARYVRTWPMEKEQQPAEPPLDFYRRHGEGDVKLGEERVTEDGKLDPKEFIFFEPEEPEICINPQNIFDHNKYSSHYEKFMQELEMNGKLSLAKSFSYLLCKARIMRYNSCFLMLIGLKNYYWHMFYNKGTSASASVSVSVSVSVSGEGDGGKEGESWKKQLSSKRKNPSLLSLSEPKRGLHMPMKNLVEACLELEMWLKRQVTYDTDREKEEHLRSLLDPKLVKLLDEQMDCLQKELLLRAMDIFDYPEWYNELSDQYLENVGEGVAFLGFSEEDLSGEFPRPMYHLGAEDEGRQSLYRRIVSQAIDSYFYNDWNARMELWAFQRSPVRERWGGAMMERTGGLRQPSSMKSCMKFIASKPMGDLTDTRMPGVVYIATEVGVKLIAIKRSTFVN